MRNLFVSIIFCSISFAEHGGQTASGKGNVSLTATANALVKVKGNSLASRNSQKLDYDYTMPNELMNSVMEDKLPKSGGALVSVGTFRALNLASSGKVSHLVLLDYNPGIKIFNLINLQLMSLARDRFEYLSLLTTGELHLDLIADARAGKISIPNFVKALNERMKKFYEDFSSKKAPYPVWERWRSLGVVLPKPTTWADAESAKSDRLEDRLHAELEMRLNQYEKFGVMDKTVFGSDARFNKIKQMTLKDQITVFQADLTKPTESSNLGRALNAAGIKVGTVDVSNVPNYAFNFGESPRSNFGLIQKSLEALPLSQDAQLFVTESSPRRSEIPDGQDYWNYFSVPKKDWSKLANLFPEKLPLPRKEYPSSLPEGEAKDQAVRAWGEFNAKVEELEKSFQLGIEETFPPVHKPSSSAK